MAETARYCRACGKKLKEGTTFCPYCGERIEAPSDSPAREARGSEAEISAAAQDVQAAVPKQAPSSTTASQSPTTRTRVFNPVTTPARASERLGSSSLVKLGVWIAAGIGFISAAITFVSFADSLGQTVAELSVLAVPQAALGAAIYAVASLMLIFLIGGLGMGLLRRILAQRQLRPGRVVAAFVRALIVAVIVAAGMLFVVLRSTMPLWRIRSRLSSPAARRASRRACSSCSAACGRCSRRCCPYSVSRRRCSLRCSTLSGAERLRLHLHRRRRVDLSPPRRLEPSVPTK